MTNQNIKNWSKVIYKPVDNPTVINPDLEKIIFPVGPAPIPQKPQELKPQLFLIEYYALSTYLGDLGKSNIISTFNMLPEEEQNFSVVTKRRIETTTSITESVVESQDQSVVNNLNQSIRSDDMKAHSNDKYDYHLDASFEGDSSWSPATASVDADLAVRGGSNVVRDEFKKSVSNPMESQISQTADYRNEKVYNTSKEQKVDQQTETVFTRNIKNLNSHEVTFVFYQLSQEYITFLNLIDVKLGFRNTNTKMDETVPLSSMDSLLDKVIAQPHYREKVKGLIIGELQTIFDYQDEPRSLIKERPLLGADGKPSDQKYFQIDPNLETEYQLKDSDGTIRRSFKLPGIIMKVERKVLPINNIAISVLHDKQGSGFFPATGIS